MTPGAVVRAADVQANRTAAGACVRAIMTTASAGPQLARRLVDIPPRARFDGTAATAGELWFVIAGTGQLDVDGHPALPVTRDHAVWMPPGARYRLRAGSPAGLHLDTVALPSAAGESVSRERRAAPGSDPPSLGTPGPESPDSDPPDSDPPDPDPPDPDLRSAGVPESAGPLTADLGECEVEMTGDRRFRVLFGPGRGCAVATQFVGEIPPGRAPDHSHPYDELVLVLEGDGVLRTGGRDHVLAPGTCAHLPPGQLHSLENTGPATLRVLGVFHPADSPAAKEDRTNAGA